MKLPRLRVRRPGPRTLSDAIDVAGLACLDGAAWWWQPHVGLVAIGCTLLLIGWVMDR